ncbi:hypothetical protein GOODEAATRI_001809 [Goodea atripinnis]|uniref:ABC transporter domain-containing protein n=1 Tax=Goodea atripinnis TaxID=208336 RepID=A0ABV0MXW9_9TELE
MILFCSYGLLGPSGCGKTTLLKCIVGTLKISRGHITVLGKPPAFPGHEVPGKMVGYMPQDLALYNEFTISDTLAFFGRIHGLTSKETRARMDFLIDFLHLPQKHSLVRNLSTLVVYLSPAGQVCLDRFVLKAFGSHLFASLWIEWHAYTNQLRNNQEHWRRISLLSFERIFRDVFSLCVTAGVSGEGCLSELLCCRILSCSSWMNQLSEWTLCFELSMLPPVSSL